MFIRCRKLNISLEFITQSYFSVPKDVNYEAKYDLDRKDAKISALSSNNLGKYEYLTGEDLDLKPSTVEQARFEYSPLGKFFDKGLKEEDNKEGLLKRLRNIEDKNEEQLKAIKDQGKKQLEEIKNITTESKSSKIVGFFGELSPKAKKLLDVFKEEKNSIDSKELVCIKSDGTIFNFNVFKISLDFASDIYNGKISLQIAKNFQYKMFELLNKLKE